MMNGIRSQTRKAKEVGAQKKEGKDKKGAKEDTKKIKKKRVN